VIYVVVRLLLKRQTATVWNYLGYGISLGMMGLSYSGLSSSLTPTYSATGDLIFAGADLKAGGMLEYYQDVAYLCMFALAVGAWTDWAWLVFATIPAYGFFMLWKYIISPWLNAPTQSSTDMYDSLDDASKKRLQKKERQAARREKFTVRR
jgi:hypothetical protein